MATKRIELKDSGIIFNEEDHTYLLGDKYLSGITGMLQRQFSPTEFEGIPKDVLNAAAQYGTDVHKSCEEFDMNWTNDGTVEVSDYIQICKDNGLTHECSEYCVTDGENWASQIDKVYRTSVDTFDLADIKTYGIMTADKLAKARWQLSIYAYLFELQNKKAKVGRLFIIHLRNREKNDGTFDHIADIIFVERIPGEICQELLETDFRGEQFKDPYSIPEEVSSQEAEIRDLIETKNAIEERLASIKASILNKMESLDIRTWATETMRLTRKLPTTRASFNSSLFKADHPEIDFSPYEKESRVAGSLLITV
jgi:hypothetical protein